MSRQVAYQLRKVTTLLQSMLQPLYKSQPPCYASFVWTQLKSHLSLSDRRRRHARIHFCWFGFRWGPFHFLIASDSPYVYIESSSIMHCAMLTRTHTNVAHYFRFDPGCPPATATTMTKAKDDKMMMKYEASSKVVYRLYQHVGCVYHLCECVRPPPEAYASFHCTE